MKGVWVGLRKVRIREQISDGSYKSHCAVRGQPGIKK